MRAIISKGNTKLGGVMNISMTPGKSCLPNVPCYKDGCYARKSYNQYPNVRKAWDSNLKYATDNMFYYMSDIKEVLDKKQPANFRWHVAGDILNQRYYDFMVEIAKHVPDTSFLCFTKQYNLCYDIIPENLSLFMSAWPGMELPIDNGIPIAWLEEDERKPEEYFRCVGHCGECNYTCWKIGEVGLPVVFPKH